MRIHSRTETEVKITQTEFLEALGLTEGDSIAEISEKWDPDFWRVGAGATVVTIKLTKHKYSKRKPRPRRK